jgi:hypothetical protein
MSKRHLELENKLENKKIRNEQNTLQISPLCAVLSAPPSKYERGIMNFDQAVHIRGRFVADREDNLKYGKHSNLVLKITKNYHLILKDFFRLVYKVMKLRWNQTIRDPVIGFKKILPVYTSGQLLDIIRPHLQTQNSSILLDCDIVVSGIMFKDDNDVRLCMKMYDVIIPSCSNMTDRLSVSNDVNCKLILSDSKNCKSQFVAFENPIIVSGIFSISEIRDIQNSKYTKVFFQLSSSDGQLFDAFIGNLRETVSADYMKNIVSPLQDLKLPVKLDPDLASYTYPYLDSLDTYYKCEIHISGLFVSGLKAYLCLDMHDINICE